MLNSPSCKSILTMTSNPVDIGVLEEKSNWLLQPKFFPSKVGGKPAWLDLKNICSPAQLTCKKCKNPFVFLCQVYAPYEERDDCFHRTIFIFVCRNGSCCRTNSADNFIVLRCQLPRENIFYSFHPYPENENESFSMENWSNLCYVCGIKGPSHCSKCKKTFYCSREHQILDWHKSHKEDCLKLQGGEILPVPNFVVTVSGRSILFNEWELVVDAEDEEENTIVDENKEMEKLRKMVNEKNTGTLSDISESELEQYARNIPEDKVFNKFNKRVSRHPEQVLRYDRGGTPLWITEKTENALIDIPKCQYCDSERQFEFQVMPQLLNFINVGIDFNSLDWGVLAIYTCKKSCNDGPSYKEEFIIKQDLCN